jgi:hypothetical protein
VAHVGCTYVTLSQLGGFFEQKTSCEKLTRFIEAIWLSDEESLRGCNGLCRVMASGRVSWDDIEKDTVMVVKRNM